MVKCVWGPHKAMGIRSEEYSRLCLFQVSINTVLRGIFISRKSWTSLQKLFSCTEGR